MKTTIKLFFTLCLWMAVATWIMVSAANTTTTVEQVTNKVSLTTDVDYVITSTIPFTANGNVNIQNTDHAVVIIKNIKPSVVISKWLKYVTIEGATAANNVNCQVRMYDRGSIILPYYSDIRPLVCYTEQNFQGTSCDNYTEGSSGGFMKSLTSATLNNQIRSFTLKRGYMVTFAIGSGGWGYSRCFIADKADLEFKTLPAILDRRISSYRLFQWYNYNKLGIANDTRYESCNALNVTGCYGFGGGETRLPDTECIPHHIYEDWPSAAACGSANFSCHMKTNNEPGNSADDHPQDVATVLANWQNLMRTGMRLCSESSHDGSWNHLRAFIDSIDARGWRCDILDLHCYWDTGFSNMAGYYGSYGNRPIWISEWIWGASWNRNGCFADGRTEQQIITRTTEILSNLNNSPQVERYFYWNSESKGHIYENGKLTELGKVYAAQETGLGYNSNYECIPKNTRVEPIGALNGNYNRNTGVLPLIWSDPNGDLMESISIQRKDPGGNFFNEIGEVTPKDKSSAAGVSYLYNDTITEPGVYIYRIKAVTFNNKIHYSEELQVQVAPAQGNNTFQHGRLTLGDEEPYTTYFSENFENTPAVFIGTMTNKNPTYYASNFTSKTVNRNSFTYQFQPWSTNKGTMKNNEELPFLAIEKGAHTFGSLQCEVGESKSEKSSGDNLFSDVTEVTFETPFPDGVVPVVLTEIRNPVYTSTGFGVRVFDVTNTGFKYIVYTEDANGVKVTLGKNVCYLAITPGVGTIDEENNIYIAAGFGTDSQIYGSSQRDVNFYLHPNNGENVPLYMLKPTILTALQTNNYPALCMLRRTDITESDSEGTQWTTGTKVKRILDHDIVVDGTKISSTSATEATAAYRDDLGWVAVSSVIQAGEMPTSIDVVSQSTQKLLPMVENGKITVPGHQTFEVYSITGTRVNSNGTLPSGIYVVRAGKQSAKVIVR